VPRPVRLDASAERDVDEAYAWYEHELPGLGERFLAALARALELVEANPESCTPVRGRFEAPVRSQAVAKFPFRVVFLAFADRSRVVAVAHTRQAPERLRARIRTSDP
jgi:plasmid stabilization system protein ParE